MTHCDHCKKHIPDAATPNSPYARIVCGKCAKRIYPQTWDEIIKEWKASGGKTATAKPAWFEMMNDIDRERQQFAEKKRQNQSNQSEKL